MSDAQLFTSTYLRVEHLQPDSGNANTEGFVQDAGLQAAACNLQPTSPNLIALNGGAYGKAYTIFTTASGILETDRVTTVSGSISQQFIVKGRQYYNYGVGQHIELYVEEVQ